VTAAPLEDPSERELVLHREAPALAFGPKALAVSPDELMRFVGLDLAAGVPIEIGTTGERFSLKRGEATTQARFFLLGSALGIATDVDEPQAAHRVLEVLGIKGDVRVRINMTRARTRKLAPVGGPIEVAPEAGEALGNVRVWGGEPGEAERALASIHRHLKLAGLEPSPAHEAEPRFVPPAADRWLCDLPLADIAVTTALIELLQAHTVEGARIRPPRRLALLEDRVKRADGGLLAYRYEVHRAGTGLVHLRRREVEAGPGRPGLVRTWNVTGLRGGVRLRLRDVAGRAVAEAGGSREGVVALAGFLRVHFQARS
jgi:hypothetical protein